MNKKTEVIKEPRNAPATSELMLPFNSAAVLWRAKFLAPSYFLDHLPFLFWLVADIRPSQVVTLGLNDGVAHFAVCQAVEKLGLDTLCFGFALEKDAEEEAGKSSDAEGLSSILEYNRVQYQEFSSIRYSSSDAYADHFGDGTIDLIVLETFPDEKQTDEVIANWLPKLAQKGIVVLPGKRGGSGSELLKKVRYLVGKRRTIHFQYGSDLVVVLPDSDAPGQLLALFDAVNGASQSSPIVRFFERMGRQYSMEVAAKVAKDAVQAVELESKNNRAWAKRLDEENSKLNAIYDEQQDLQARLKSQLNDAQHAVVRSQSQAEEADARILALSSELEKSKRDNAKLESEIAEKRAVINRKEQEVGSLSESLGQVNQEVEQLRLERDEFRRTVDDLYNSSSSQAEEANARILALSSELEVAKKTASDLEVLLCKKDRELSQLGSKLEDANATLLQQSADIEIRFEEIAALTEKLSEVELQSDGSRQDNAKLESAIAEKRAVINRKEQEVGSLSESLGQVNQEVEQLRLERDELRRIVDDLYNSSSWRITAPVRSIVRTVRRD